MQCRGIPDSGVGHTSVAIRASIRMPSLRFLCAADLQCVCAWSKIQERGLKVEFESGKRDGVGGMTVVCDPEQ
eukprot:5407655-Pyramimonas_sp.AAC.1